MFSKDAEKGISISDILNQSNKSGNDINVNGYLWRASLNILSVVPLISTDALGGTIITDWYVKKNIKDKRIKITAYIKTSELRSDGIEVKVHVQQLINNVWSDTITDNNLASKIENTILNEAETLIKSGVKEIILLGQNVNAYSYNQNSKEYRLSNILNELAKYSELKRIRYTTSHPKDMTDDLIDCYKINKKLMPFIHLPIQSGSNKILKLMNRKHTVEEYIQVCLYCL